MNGDPNSVRDDVLGALALIEATIEGMSDSPDKLRLAFASATLRRANEKLRASAVPQVPANLNDTNVLPFPGHSVKAS